MAHINLGENYWGFNIPKIEKYYGAKYVGDFPLPLKDEGFADFPASIFWRPENLRTANFSEYFGFYLKPHNKYPNVFNAEYITEYIFNGLQFHDEVIYSRYKRDFRTFDKSVISGCEDMPPYTGPHIDGGFDYCKWSAGADGEGKLVRLQVIEGVITIL